MKNDRFSYHDLYERAKAALKGTTPGPWRAWRDFGGTWSIECDDGTVAQIDSWSQSQDEADATLIALAPELARALIREREAAEALAALVQDWLDYGEIFSDESEDNGRADFVAALAAYRAAREGRE
jgi:hypothetical protein